jgi:hypothetical protein
VRAALVSPAQESLDGTIGWWLGDGRAGCDVARASEEPVDFAYFMRRTHRPPGPGALQPGRSAPRCYADPHARLPSARRSVARRD